MAFVVLIELNPPLPENGGKSADSIVTYTVKEAGQLDAISYTGKFLCVLELRPISAATTYHTIS